MEPARCSSPAELSSALGKCESLGRELGRHVDDDFRLIALKDLVPKGVLDMITAQPGLSSSYPDALTYVRSFISTQRNASQVAEVQRQAKHGSVPMYIGSLVQAIYQLSGSTSHHVSPCGEHAQADAHPCGEHQDQEEVWMTTLVAALKDSTGGNGANGGEGGKGKGLANVQ